MSSVWPENDPVKRPVTAVAFAPSKVVTPPTMVSSVWLSLLLLLW